MFPSKTLQLFTRSGWSMVMRVAHYGGGNKKGYGQMSVNKRCDLNGSQLSQWSRVSSHNLNGRLHNDETESKRKWMDRFMKYYEEHLRNDSIRRLFIAAAFFRFIVHRTKDKNKSLTMNLYRLISPIVFLLFSRNKFFRGKPSVIDGLNKKYMLSTFDKRNLSGLFIVVWRDLSRNPPSGFSRKLKESNGRIVLLRVQHTSKCREIDDLLAILLTLLTNGRLYTDDMLCDHFENFQNFYEDMHIEFWLRKHLKWGKDALGHYWKFV